MPSTSSAPPPVGTLTFVPLAACAFLLLQLAAYYAEFELPVLATVFHELLTIPSILLVGAGLLMGVIKARSLVRVMGWRYGVVMGVLGGTAGVVVVGFL